MIKTIAMLAAASLLLGAAGAKAKDRAKAPAAAKPSCERGSYPGDPVCDIGDGNGSLPMPTDRQVRRERDGLAVSDDVRLKGRSDFNNNRYGGTQFNNPNLHPRGADVNGGGGVDLRF